MPSNILARRCRRAVGTLLVAVLAATSLPASAADLSVLSPVVRAIVTSINTLACQPDGGCPNEPPSVGTPGTDITSEQVVLAIGRISENVGVELGEPLATVNLLGYCEHYLETFLANTAYLGYLLDYGTCLEAGAAPAVLATLPQYSGGVKFLAGACTFFTKAYEYYSSATPRGTRVAFNSTTDCRNSNSLGVYGLQAHVGAQTSLQDALRVESGILGPWVTGNNYASSSATFVGNLAAAVPSATGKVGIRTILTPATGSCSGLGYCSYAWVVLPNKNPDTGADLSCAPSGQTLDCRATGLPMTDTTIAKK